MIEAGAASVLAALPVREVAVGAAAAVVGAGASLLAGRLAGRPWSAAPGAWVAVAGVLVVGVEAPARVVVAVVLAAAASALGAAREPADAVARRGLTTTSLPVASLALTAVVVAASATSSAPAAAAALAAAGVVAVASLARVGADDASLPTLLVVASVGGLGLGLPDTEATAAALGGAVVLAIEALVASRPPPRGTGALDGLPAVPLLVWLVGTSSLDRASLVIGGSALVLLALPVAVAAVAVGPSGLVSGTTMRRWSAFGTAVVAAVVVARLGMVRSTDGRAVLVSVGALVGVGVTLVVWWRRGQSRSPAAGADGRAARDR